MDIKGYMWFYYLKNRRQYYNTYPGIDPVNTKSKSIKSVYKLKHQALLKLTA